MIPSDLAPGDAKSLAREWDDIEMHRVESGEDPYFDMAFGALWAQFGEVGEIEEAAVLSRRLCWHGREMINGYALLYRLLVFTSHRDFAAVRDHTVMIHPDRPGAIVHLSHNLVAQAWRRTGLAGWLRTIPVNTAREGLILQDRPVDSPITLVAEMEPPDPTDPQRVTRLTAYERAGYRMVDPARCSYLQPDFRPAREIDAGGGLQPVPMVLMVRRMGREGDHTISGGELREMVEALYAMFAATFRAEDMAPLFRLLEGYPAAEDHINLLSPTSVA